MAVTSGCGETLVWDLRGGPDLSEPVVGPTHPIAATATGRLDGDPVAITVGGDDWDDGWHTGEVRLWNLRDGSTIADIDGHGWPVQQVALTRPPPGSGPSLLALTVAHHHVYPQMRVWDASTRTGHELHGPVAASLRGLADVGRTVAVFVRERPGPRHRVVLWDVAGDREFAGFDLGAGTVAVAPVHDAPVLLAVRRAPQAEEAARYVLTVWDLRTRKPRAEHALARHRRVLRLEAAVVDGVPSAVVVHGGGHVAVVDLHDGRCTASFEAGDSVEFLSCTSSRGESLAAAVTTGDRQTIEIRDLRSGTLREAFPTPYPVTSLTFDPGGALVVAADREILVLDVIGRDPHRWVRG
ncbi:WD40 repeat domain-containing protein [Streptomyces sp. NPDC041003]|uniref:WD40 repeat domain-containing protein n=1 Tax=Streptomyces sp. NPDC041003 TaxID=3155730 RepID=UPI0033F64981